MSLDYYLGLLDFETRIEAFRRGIESAVRPGDRVLEIGTGLGTFAFFAARAGAERVWAVDSDPIVHVARTIARYNGLDEAIEFVRGQVPEADLPGPFDVIVFEDFKAALLDDRTYRLLVRCHEELLREGGRFVPGRARLHLAPGRIGIAGIPPLYHGRGGSWEEKGIRYGIDWSPAREYLINQPRYATLRKEHLVGNPVAGDVLELLPPPGASALAVEGEWTMDVEGEVDVLLLWFDLEPAAGCWMSNAPGSPDGPWGQVLLPLDPPLPVRAGQRVSLSVTRHAFSDDAPGWVGWSARSEGREVSRSEFCSFPANLSDLFPPGAVDPDAGSGQNSSRRNAP